MPYTNYETGGNGLTYTVTGELSDYYIGQTEVTQALWKAIMGSIPSGQTNTGDSYPIGMLGYNHCVEFVNALNTNAQIVTQLPAGKKFKMPTEAQWQYAAMGGKYSRGYNYSGANIASDIGWSYDNTNGKCQPVAQKPANELGLYDMSGNVWERCSDWYKPITADTYQGLDYNGPSQLESNGLKVVRAGSFVDRFNSVYWTGISVRHVHNTALDGPNCDYATESSNRGFRLALQ